MVVLVLLISIYSSNKPRVASNETDTISFDSDSTRVSRTWTTYNESIQSIKYCISVASSERAEEFRNNLPINQYFFTANDYQGGFKQNDKNE